MDKIVIIGAGAWGTALAMVARRAGRNVVIQAREIEVVDSINNDFENHLFLPGHKLDPLIHATACPKEACREPDALFLVTPAQHLREMANTLVNDLGPKVPIVICAKGIEETTGFLMSEIIAEVFPENPIATLSGPTFASEVAYNLPTAVTLACQIPELAKDLTLALATSHFRIYRTDDLIGTEVGGAVKNVLAIACGIVEGRNMGENARAALITRGLAETIRLARAKGARAETLMGLSGIGDLTLTCNAVQSRNFSLGIALGQGRRLEDILSERNSVAEGVFTASPVNNLAKKLAVETPICSAVDAILNFDQDINKIIFEILRRPFVTEFI